MRTDTAQSVTRLADYAPPNFSIESVYLEFELDKTATTVRSRMELSRLAPGSLDLDGEEIDLKSIRVDGAELKRSDYKLTQKNLTLNDLPDRCTLEIETVCNPSENTRLMGLYVSGGRFCTQCEAEGFRRITFFPDRPDVMSVFTVKIIADRADMTYLLANGNMIESGQLDGDKHFAVWHDPFRKPCYLFALVAGNFDVLEDSFTTMSGRQIPLSIYVDPGNAPQAEYAMDSLKRAMLWDEQAFGREYDLDRFMVVAVRDFNFGAMENKGLNIFNSSLLLADAQTATDMNFERIESVVAHEYFHNWTGNRITCRDWFQLCLKEGFTVFRDQEFSAHERGAAVQRIKDVRALRSRQFPEDGGPLAHPVRPTEYMKIDNFYTSTIYEKGAELIRMLKIFLGADMFRKGCDHYFDTLDGTAATVEQFVSCFEDVSGRDLSQFMRWYSQAGTPHLGLKFEAATQGYHLSFKQKTPPTPGQARKQPQVIPIKWQMVYDNGSVSEPQLSVLMNDQMKLEVQTPAGVKATPSVLQDFSAPVILHSNLKTDDYLRLMAHDSNAFNRWEAGQTIARGLLSRMAESIRTGKIPAPDVALGRYIQSLAITLDDTQFDDAFKALALSPPSDMEVMQGLKQSDPVAVNIAGQWLERAIGDGLRDKLISLYKNLADEGPFSPAADAAGRRALRNRALSLLASRKDPEAPNLAMEQLVTAENMTNEIAALITLTRLGGRRIERSMTEFYEKWQDNPLVVDKWFAVYASRTGSQPTEHVARLLEHPAFDFKNPNRVRALFGGFAMSNPQGFHHISGAGYQFFTDNVLKIDKINPQVAARLLGLFEIWRRLDDDRQALIKSQLKAIIAAKPSKNTLEIASKTLGKS